MAQLQLRGVKKTFGTVEVLDSIDLDVADREFAVFVGPSGCGKSTLLRLIAGLEEVSAGTIRIGDNDVTHDDPADRGVAMVFQSYALYPHMSVRENMAFGLKMAGMKRNDIQSRITKAARTLHIEELLDRKPRELSGGQRQRVAIGRAIVREPRIFLFDEPLSNLDASLRVQMRTELAKLHSELEATMIYVTHDQVEAMTMADQIIVLNEGRIEQVGSPLDLYRSPANRFVAGFIGSPRMNFLTVPVTGVDAAGATLALPGESSLKLAVKPDGISVGDEVVLGARPEHLDGQGAGDAHIPGEVLVIEHLGSETLAYARAPDGNELLVTGPGDWPIRLGETMRIGVPSRLCHLFHAAGQAFEQLS